MSYPYHWYGIPRACWLKQYSVKERACEGRIDRAHLLPQQLLKREGHAGLCPDPRTWVPACRWHHSQFDNYRGVIIPRAALPQELEELAEKINLGWYLDRRYGPKEVQDEQTHAGEEL